METKVEECPTGILVDVEETNGIQIKDGILPVEELTRTNAEDLDGELEYACKTPVMRKLRKAHNKCLQNDQICGKSMEGISKAGWMTPSPKSMRKISNEASRIIDKLHSSPLESSDMLCNEEFPVLSSFDDALDEVFEMPSKYGDECEVSTNNSITLKEKKSQVEANYITGDCNENIEDKSVEPQEKSPSNFITIIKNEDSLKKPSSSSNAKSTLILIKTPLRLSYSKNKENVSQEAEDKDKLSSLSLFKCTKNSLSGRKSLLEELKITKSIVLNKSIDLSLRQDNTKSTIPSEKRKSLSSKSICQNITTKKPSEIVPPCSGKPNTMQPKPVSIKKSSLCKSVSLVGTPSSGKVIRRTSSFQTELVRNCNKIRQENNFSAASSHPEIMNSRFNSTLGVANKLVTPLKYGATLSKTPRASISVAIPTSSNVTEKSSRISRPSFSSARGIKTTVKISPPLSTFRKPMTSVSNRIRFSSRLDLPSPLPQKMSENLPRKLFT